jgi:hypothetical protein
MSFGIWNVSGLEKAGSLTAAARDLAMCKLDLMGLQEVMWDLRDTVRAGNYNVFYKKGYENRKLGTGLLCTTEWYQQLRE